MAENGILIDYDWCTGCRTCDMACQMEHGFPVGKTGVKVLEVGPWQIEGDKWQYDYLPAITDMCDSCAERTAAGKQPTCVKHCQSQCLTFGPLDELYAKLKDHRKQVVYAL
ncbi:4Fe-4S dicluster domain-containing protein [uncultured Ellagibacter sp.]|uniref:4Fe-4S dicluster domain-containing protein n=1 Tax=uncultured Ellagibacter sp. TaxID=2137580 RepID=UPI00261EF4DB|nr:4Fe-4S dicluster domain-containing protein [uncultured Ellagibacter sp.]